MMDGMQNCTTVRMPVVRMKRQNICKDAAGRLEGCRQAELESYRQAELENRQYG
jgi:hypothetical protein